LTVPINRVAKPRSRFNTLLRVLALARAVLAQPRVLVLDDTLSALDVHTEKLVEEALRPVLEVMDEPIPPETFAVSSIWQGGRAGAWNRRLMCAKKPGRRAPVPSPGSEVRAIPAA
jgi:hypothetical protein